MEEYNKKNTSENKDKKNGKLKRVQWRSPPRADDGVMAFRGFEVNTVVGPLATRVLYRP